VNPIEARIYSDAHAAAAQITDADIPALRLDAAPARPLRRKPAPGNGRMRWLAPLAAAASVLLIAAVLVVVRNETAAGPAAAQQALAAEMIDDVLFPATSAERTKGLELDWAELGYETRQYDSCMTAAGYRQPPFSISEQSFLSYDGYFFDPGSLSPVTLPGWSIYLGDADSLQMTGNTPEASASDRCGQASQTLFYQLVKADSLSVEWLAAATRASAPVATLRPGFSQCMEDHGVPASYATNTVPGFLGLYAIFSGWINQLFSQHGLTSLSTAAERNEAAALNKQWTPVFARCAGPAIAALNRLLPVRRARFLAANARQIGQLTAEAKRLKPVSGAPS
jgi:hypothetical protein